MPRRAILRSVVVFAAACIFGVVDAIVKGHHGGTRNAIGNLSAVWVAVPFLAGAFVVPRRVAVGAGAGVAATVLALASYSLARSGAHVGVQGGAAGAFGSAGLGNRYFLAGVFGGLALGALGAWLTARRWWHVVVAVAAGLFVLEPAARMAWAIDRGQGVGTLLPSPSVWAIEVILGCASLVLFHLRRTWRH